MPTFIITFDSFKSEIHKADLNPDDRKNSHRPWGLCRSGGWWGHLPITPSMRLVSLRRSVRPPTYHTVHEAGVVQEVGEAGHVLQVLGVLPHLLHQLEALTLNTFTSTNACRLPWRVEPLCCYKLYTGRRRDLWAGTGWNRKSNPWPQQSLVFYRGIWARGWYRYPSCPNSSVVEPEPPVLDGAGAVIKRGGSVSSSRC